MTQDSRYKSGDYLVICDECGFEFYRSECRKRWDKAIVCKDDWEPRHPQEFLRGIREKIRVEDPRPDTEPVFLSVNEVTQDDL